MTHEFLSAVPGAGSGCPRGGIGPSLPGVFNEGREALLIDAFASFGIPDEVPDAE